MVWYTGWSSQTRHAPTLQSISFPGRAYHRQESRFHTSPGTHHEGSRFKVVPIVLLSAAPNSYNPALTISIRHSNFGACFHLFTHQFFQQPHLRDERVSSWSSSVGPEFLSAPDSENQEMRPDLNRCSTGSPLATVSSSYSIQFERHHKKLSRGSSPSILDRALSLYQRKSRWGATYDLQHKSSSWSLVSVRSALVVVVSPSHQRNCGTYFQLIFDPLYKEPQLFRKRLKTHYMQQSILHHWGSMSPVRHLLLYYY